MYPPKPDGRRRVLLINAVTWSDAYPQGHPLTDVRAWYARWFGASDGVAWESQTIEDDLVSSIRSGVHGVVMSGSPRDAWRDDPVNDRLLMAIRLTRDLGLPFLGVCFGHQLLARALGGVVAPDPRGLELGNTPVTLTPAGRACPLFRGFKDDFEVLSSHSDAVLSMPPECELLVRGQLTENQGFHWRNRMFGVQFHPETDAEVLRFIWQPRLDKWRSRVSFDLPQTLAEMRSTPGAAEVLRNFVSLCT